MLLETRCLMLFRLPLPEGCRECGKAEAEVGGHGTTPTGTRSKIAPRRRDAVAIPPPSGGVDARGITAPQRRRSTHMAMDTEHSGLPTGRDGLGGLSGEAVAIAGFDDAAGGGHGGEALVEGRGAETADGAERGDGLGLPGLGEGGGDAVVNGDRFGGG